VKVSFDAAGKLSVFDDTDLGRHKPTANNVVSFSAADVAGNVADPNAAFVHPRLQSGPPRRLAEGAGVATDAIGWPVDPLDPKHVAVAYMDMTLVTTATPGLGVAVVARRLARAWQPHRDCRCPAGSTRGPPTPSHASDRRRQSLCQLTWRPRFSAPSRAKRTPASSAQRRAFASDVRSACRPTTACSSSRAATAAGDLGPARRHRFARVPTVLIKLPFEIIPEIAVDTFRNLPNGQPNRGWERCTPSGRDITRPASSPTNRTPPAEATSCSPFPRPWPNLADSASAEARHRHAGDRAGRHEFH